MAAPSRRIPGIPEAEPAPAFLNVGDQLTPSLGETGVASVVERGWMRWPWFRIGVPSGAQAVTGSDTATVSLLEAQSISVSLAVSDVLVPTFNEPPGISIFSDVSDVCALSLSEVADVQAEGGLVFINVTDELFTASFREISVSDTLP